MTRSQLFTLLISLQVTSPALGCSQVGLEQALRLDESSLHMTLIPYLLDELIEI